MKANGLFICKTLLFFSIIITATACTEDDDFIHNTISETQSDAEETDPPDKETGHNKQTGQNTQNENDIINSLIENE